MEKGVCGRVREGKEDEYSWKRRVIVRKNAGGERKGT